MSTEENKRVARRMSDEVWNLGRIEVLDEICAPTYKLREYTLAELKAGVVAMRKSFPDLHFTIEEMIAEGDTVASRWTWRATHLGDYDGIAPTGKVLVDTGITFFHLVDGKIVDDSFESSMPDTRAVLLAAG